MAGQDYTPNGSTPPAFPWTLVKDGEQYNFDTIQQSGDPKRGLFAKLMDAIAYLIANTTDGTTGILAQLAKQVASAGETLVGGATYTDPASASQGTLAAGTLEARLHALFAGKAGLTAALNHLTGALTVDGTITGNGTIVAEGDIQGDTITAETGVVTPSLTLTNLKIPDGGYVSRASSAISTSATSVTIDAGVHALAIAASWAGSGDKLAVTVTYSGSDKPDFELHFLPTHDNAQIVVNSSWRATGAAVIKLRWDGSAFHSNDTYQDKI